MTPHLFGPALTEHRHSSAALAQVTSDGTLPATRIAPGGVAERLIAPVLKFELEILDSIGLLFPAMSRSSFNRLIVRAEDGQMWTVMARFFFGRLLLRVTSSSPRAGVYLAEIRFNSLNDHEIA